MKAILKDYLDLESLVADVMDLVRIPSYPGIPRQETAVAEALKQKFLDAGIEAYTDETEDGRCNIYAKLSGSGGGKNLLLSGHMDTVSPNNHPRGLDPYLEDGKLFGRGTCDMKGALCCMLAAMKAIKDSGLPHKGDILFAGVCDEEMKSIGTIDAIEKGHLADGVIIGEPTQLQVHRAQRGLEWYQFTFYGKTVHGGRQREGINAINMAQKFLNAVMEDLAPRIFARKHDLLVESTVNIATIQGGTGLSTVPGLCKVGVDRRFLPYEDFNGVGKEFQDILDQLTAEDPTFKADMIPDEEAACKPGYMHVAFETPAEDPLVQAARRSAAQVRGFDEEPGAHVAWTDAALFAVYGKIPAVIIGPGEGRVCHSECEYVPLTDYENVSMEYALTALDFCNQD